MSKKSPIKASQAREKSVLLLFCETVLSNKKEDPAALVELLNKNDANITYSYAFYENLLHEVSKTRAVIIDTATGKDLKSFDLIYHRRWSDNPAAAASVATYLQKTGTAFIDSEANYSGSIDKLSQHWKLWANDLPFPHTVLAPKAYVSKWLSQDLAKTFSFPVIMKGRNGTRGDDNYLVETVEEARRLVKSNPKIDFLIQEYIPNDGDYRVLVTGDEISLVIHRQSSDDSHKNNTSKGGKARIVKTNQLSRTMQADSIRAAQVFGRNLAGVDLVIHKHSGQHYFFEVNRAPQITDSSFEQEKSRVINNYFDRLIGQGLIIQPGDSDE